MSKEDKNIYDKENYAGTSFVGKTGIEKQYETILHGKTGEKQIERNVAGRVVGSKVITPSVIDYNLMKTNKAIYKGSGSNNITNEPAKFKDAYNFNFDLDTLSAAKNMAFPLTPPINGDFLNRTRIGIPDIGAYESQY